MEQKSKTNFLNFPKEIQHLKRYVNWGMNKKKIRQASSPKTGFKGWQNNAVTLEEAKSFAIANNCGIGFSFKNQTEPKVWGLDVDGVIDLKTGRIEPWAYAVIEYFASYTEYSMSYTGVKILVFGSTAEKLKDIHVGETKHGKHKQQIEIMHDSGCFALTGDIYKHRGLVR